MGVRFSALTTVFVFVFGIFRVTYAIGTPFGLAAGTTGGGNATPATPSSIEELASWLSDSTARVIVLNKIYDFTNAEGTLTGIGCKSWTCSPNPQLTIVDSANDCDGDTTSITYYAAARSNLKVASNKTLLGQGNNSGIKGKGLKIAQASNVIIQNIRITDLNAEFVWGGDAIQLEGSNRVWIDHNYIQHIGRQMIVSHYEANYAVTISNNVFNGDSVYSTGCDGQAYWVALILGPGDQITFALNHLYRTAGRGPHVGGTSGNYQNMHIYNNYFNNIGGHAIDPEVGSKVLVEGNYFNGVSQPLVPGNGGQAYAPLTSAQASACSSKVGRSCVVNAVGSGSGALTATDTGTLNDFTAATYKSSSIMAATDVPNYVQKNAGTGIVN